MPRYPDLLIERLPQPAAAALITARGAAAAAGSAGQHGGHPAAGHRRLRRGLHRRAGRRPPRYGDRLARAGQRRALSPALAGHALAAVGHPGRRGALAYHWASFVFTHDQAQFRAALEAMAAAWTKAAPLLSPPMEILAVPFAGLTLPGYLRLPAGVDRPPVVVLLPGADSGKEELFNLADHIVARGWRSPPSTGRAREWSASARNCGPTRRWRCRRSSTRWPRGRTWTAGGWGSPASPTAACSRSGPPRWMTGSGSTAGTIRARRSRRPSGSPPSTAGR